jgi:hypothetical protein
MQLITYTVQTRCAGVVYCSTKLSASLHLKELRTLNLETTLKNILCVKLDTLIKLLNVK